MFKKETGDKVSTASIKPAGATPVAGSQMSNGSMDYLSKNMSQAQSDVAKVKRTKVKK